MEPLIINLTSSKLEEIGFDGSDIYNTPNVAYHPVILNNLIEIKRLVLNDEFFSGWIEQPQRVWPVSYGCDYFDEVVVTLSNRNVQNEINLGNFTPPLVEPFDFHYNISNYNSSHNTDFWGFTAVKFTLIPIPIGPMVYERAFTANGEYTILKANDTYGMSSVTFNVSVPNETQSLVREYDSSIYYQFFNYTPQSPYIGYGNVQIRINPIETSVKQMSITTNGSLSITPDDNEKPLREVNLSVNVLPNLQNLLVTNDGVYNASSYNVDGFSEVTVSVDKRPTICKIVVGSTSSGIVDFVNDVFSVPAYNNYPIPLNPGNGLVLVSKDNTNINIWAYYCTLNNTGGIVNVGSSYYYKIFNSGNIANGFRILDGSDNTIIIFEDYDFNEYYRGFIMLSNRYFKLPEINN